MEENNLPRALLVNKWKTLFKQVNFRVCIRDLNSKLSLNVKLLFTISYTSEPFSTYSSSNKSNLPVKGSVNTEYKCYVLCWDGIRAPQKITKMYSMLHSVFLT